MNYKETKTPITGETATWVRANQVFISNEFNQIPSIRFQEEMITLYPDNQTVKKPLTAITEKMTDATHEFDLIMPDTGAVVDKMTYGELQMALYSLYLHLAAKRDEENEKRYAKEVSL